jgi:hypothetical protein
MSFSARLRGGATLFGGTSTGRTLQNRCEVEDPNFLQPGTTGLRFCDDGQFDVPRATLFKLAGTYPLPYGIRVSANLQSTPGTDRTITYQVTRAQVPTLTQASVLVRLSEPGSSYNDRVTQFDLSLTKSFRLDRGIEVRPEVGLFNLFNANPVLTQTNAYGSALNNAVAILEPRLIRLGLYVKF